MSKQETPEGACHPTNCSPFDLLMAHIDTMRKRAYRMKREAEEEGDTEAAGKNMRVYCVLEELRRLGNSMANAKEQAAP